MTKTNVQTQPKIENMVYLLLKYGDFIYVEKHRSGDGVFNFQLLGAKITSADDPYKVAIQVCLNKAGLKVTKEQLLEKTASVFSDKDDSSPRSQKSYVFQVNISSELLKNMDKSLFPFSKKDIGAGVTSEISFRDITKKIVEKVN